MDFARRMIDRLYRGGSPNLLLPYTPYSIPRSSLSGIPSPYQKNEAAKKVGLSPLSLAKKYKTGKGLYNWATRGVTSGKPTESLGNILDYAKAAKSALSSGVGSTSSWYAGTQAADIGVNEGTQLSLIEGGYGPTESPVLGAGLAGGAITGGALAVLGYAGLNAIQDIFFRKRYKGPNLRDVAEAWARGKDVAYSAAYGVPGHFDPALGEAYARRIYAEDTGPARPRVSRQTYELGLDVKQEDLWRKELNKIAKTTDLATIRKYFLS